MSIIKERILNGIAIMIAFGIAISVWILTFQYIGVDSANKATLISGLLSMFGGMVGAFSAYLIAREQITKQLDIQDKKDRGRMLLEIRLNKAEGVLDILTKTKADFFSLHGSWSSVIYDYINYLNNQKKQDKIDYEKLMNKELVEILELNRDSFVRTYSECYKFKPYFPEIITSIEEDHNELFKGLTLDINKVMTRFSGADYRCANYKELWDSIERLVNEINSNFELIFDKVEMHIQDIENEIAHLIVDFNN